MKARAIAIKTITDVLNGKSLDEALSKRLTKARSDDAAFIQELSYGAIRHFYYLREIVRLLSQKPIKDSRVLAACLIGFYQLQYSNIPMHAATSETVGALNDLQIDWAKSFVNALLRRFLREKQRILTQVECVDEARFNHSNWLIKQIKNQWPAQWKTVLIENNHRPVMTLRVNHQKKSREAYLVMLEQLAISAQTVPGFADAILLDKPIAVDKLPGFFDGLVSVQDLGAQNCSEILSLKSCSKVLDACAAPGGKAAHLLEHEPNLILTAVEKSPERFKRLEDTFSRLKLSANLLCADVLDVKSWWDGKSFDAIVIDAPCSGTGVIKRHPDIKLLRRETDLPQFAKQQLDLLTALWPLLRQGGEMIYLTCSIMREENDDVIEQFLQDQADASVDAIPDEFGLACQFGRQKLPTEKNDGFFAAKLKKE